MDKYFQGKYNIKNPSLLGSMIMGEVFLKSLSTSHIHHLMISESYPTMDYWLEQLPVIYFTLIL